MSTCRRLLVALAFLFSAPAIASAATISLAWNPNSEPDLAGYVLVYGTSPGVYSSSIDVGAAVAYSVPSLSPGTRYYFAVRAYNTAGESSPLSEEVSEIAEDEPPPPPPPTGGLVAAYGFEEGSGAVAGDASGSANHGSISGATWSSAGRFGKALAFGGAGHWVTAADAVSLDLTAGMTLEAWVHPTAAADGTVIAKESADGVVYALYSFDNAPAPIAYLYTGGYWGAAGTAQLPVSAWSHLAATYDGTTLRLYVNSTLVSSEAVGSAILTSAGALRIGGNSVWGEYFQGLIDEVRIYDRALSASEIATDMSVAVVPAPADTTAPAVSVTAPVSGATVAGTVTVSASATDGVGVVGVQFTIDGVNAGVEDTTAPYTFGWNTTGVANGGHLVSAVARDAAGNRTAAAPVAVTVSNDTTPPAAGSLVAAYGFEEGAGTVTADTSGYANHGTITGAKWNDAGRFGKALRFDGNNDWITVPDAASLDLTNGMTLEAWVYPTAAGDGTVISKQSAGGLAYALYSYDNAPAPVVYVDAASYWGAAGTAPLPLNAWSHLAATYDGTTLRLFVNGTLVGSRLVGSSIVTSTGVLRIGGNSLWGEHFQGRIDEVRIYNRALAASEIADDMNRPIDKVLVLAYGFDESSGTSAFDESGRGHTGAVSGATWAAAGRFGGALQFDGINDMVTAADTIHLDLAAALTIEAWVYPTSALTSWRTAVLKETAGDLAYALYAHSDTEGTRGELNIGGAKPAVSNAGSLPLNAWTHLAVTYNGATIRLFVNGVLVSSTPATGSVISSTGALRVGGNLVWGEYFQGLIDEVRIYKRALTAAEIQADMTTPVRR